MADEFQVEVCGGNWWINSRNIFGCSPGGGFNDIAAGFGWSGGELFDQMKSGSSDESASASASDGSVVIQDVQQPLSNPNSHCWNHLSSFANNGRCETNYSPPPMLQQHLNSGMNFGQQQTVMDCPKNYDNATINTTTTTTTHQDSSTNTYKPGHQNFGLVDHQQHLTSIHTSSSSFPLNSSSSSYAYPNSPTNLMQTLFDTNTTALMNFPSTTTSATGYFPSLGEFSPCFSKFSPSMLKPSLSKRQQQAQWDPSATALRDIMPTLLPTTPLPIPSSTTSEKTNLRNHATAKRSKEEEAKKSNEEASYKRPRIETPSPLPTFKVRKEKLGDRITALQQLVSPFGKTDTASVLHEAIDYIKFLHEQVRALSAPYMKNISPGQRQQQQQGGEKSEEEQGSKQELRRRGLCLVPISTTFPVASETTTDFWAPTSFAGAFR